MKRIYKNFYPWQQVTKNKKVVLCYRFDLKFDTLKLKQDFDACLKKSSPKPQYDVYHNGGWGGICLHALNGDSENDQGGAGNYAYTNMIEEAPYIRSILDGIPGRKERVRILTKKPFTNIFWHTDENETFDKKFVRLHIPIVTNINYEFQICHESCAWNPGELWYGDFSFPHRLRNLDDKEINAHLVIDLRVSDETLEFLGKEFCDLQAAQAVIRNEARQTCNEFYYFYNLLFDVKRYKIIIQRKISNAFNQGKSLI